MTLWPFHTDEYQFPFNRDRMGGIKDAQGFYVQLYSETIQVLENLQTLNIKLAVASRITNIAAAYQLLHLFNLRKYFTCVEVYPVRKTLHFAQLKKKTGLDYSEMIFFDDNIRNLKCIEKLGVQVFQVIDGINLLQLNRIILCNCSKESTWLFNTYIKGLLNRSPLGS